MFNKDLLVQVVPQEQNFQNSRGIFHFRVKRPIKVERPQHIQSGSLFRLLALLSNHTPTAVLEVCKVGGCCHWWPPPNYQQSVAVCPLERGDRVLDPSVGESIRQVSIFGSLSKYLNFGGDCKEQLVFVSHRVCGSYADLNAGLPSDAFKDFSGGVHMMYNLKEAQTYGHDEAVWRSLQSATRCNSMVCCETTQKGVRRHFVLSLCFEDDFGHESHVVHFL